MSIEKEFLAEESGVDLDQKIHEVEQGNGEYKKLHAKAGVFEIKSRMSTGGEMFDLYFCKNQVASFQQEGLKQLMSCIFNLRDVIAEK